MQPLALLGQPPRLRDTNVFYQILIFTLSAT